MAKDYAETTEEFSTFEDLTSEVMHTLKKLADAGVRKLDAEIVIDLENHSITVVAPEQTTNILDAEID